MKVISVIIALIAVIGIGSAIDQTGANAISGYLTTQGYASDVSVRAGSLGYNVVVADLDENPANGFILAVAAVADQVSREGDPDSVSLVGVIISENGKYSLHAVSLRGSEASSLVYLANTDFNSAVVAINGKLASADRTELDSLPATIVPFKEGKEPIRENFSFGNF